jgi:hypothetical protein
VLAGYVNPEASMLLAQACGKGFNFFLVNIGGYHVGSG